MLNKEFLDAILDYNPDTGALTWKHRVDMPNNWNARFAGKRAGAVFDGRYILLSIRYERFLAHTIIWFMVYGEWVKGIDHKDGNGFNNRISNLRKATPSQNGANSYPKARGVERHGRGYRARIKVNQKRIHLGIYDTREEAQAVYNEAAIKYFGDFARCARV